MTMSDTAWLIVAVAVGMLVAVGWVSRERAIHRRRRAAAQRRGDEKNGSDSWHILRPSFRRARRREPSVVGAGRGDIRRSGVRGPRVRGRCGGLDRAATSFRPAPVRRPPQPPLAASSI